MGLQPVSSTFPLSLLQILPLPLFYSQPLPLSLPTSSRGIHCTLLPSSGDLTISTSIQCRHRYWNALGICQLFANYLWIQLAIYGIIDIIRKDFSYRSMSTVVHSAPPLFIRDSDIGIASITPFEVCSAVAKASRASKVEGVQKINNLWHLYFKDRATRLLVFSKESIMIAGRKVLLYDTNPQNTSHATSQRVRGRPLGPPEINDKLTIKYLPLSVSNDEIKVMLEEQGVELKSPILYGIIRDQDGMLTSYNNGDRFVYVKSFSPPLPRKQEVGMFQCIIVHQGKDTKCTACDQMGHKIGDSLCKAKPEQGILAFKSFQHPFSNHFPCQLEVYDKQFKSVEHAFFWRMSTELGKQDLAKKIQESEHAGMQRGSARK